MSGLEATERQQLYAALRDGLDGWSLVGASLGLDEVGADVEIGEARPEEIVAWAVGRVEHVVAAIAGGRVQAERERIAARLDCCARHGQGTRTERHCYADAARIVRGAR